MATVDRSTLQTSIDTDLASGSNITATELREICTDIIDSDSFLDDGTPLKFMMKTGTSASSQGGSTQIATLITGTVLSVICKMAGVGPNTRDPGSIEYSVAVYGANVVHVVNSASNSSGILSQPFSLIITYID